MKLLVGEMGKIDPRGGFVGVYMQAMIARSRCVLVRICISVPYGRRTECGLKYLLVDDTGSGSFPLPSDYFLVFTP
jgi:hypothetical protein